MRALETIKQKAKTVISIIDKHGPVMTTLATVAIAVLTGFYVHYSRAQWTVMSGQLAQMKTDSKTSDQHFRDTLGEMQKQSTALGTIAVAAGNMKSPVIGTDTKPLLVKTPQLGIDRFNIGEDHPGQDAPLGDIIAAVPLTANAVIKNFGQTSVTFDDVGVKLEIRSAPVPEDFHYGTTPRRNQFTIFPGQGFFTPNTSTIAVNRDDFSEIKTPRRNGKRLVFHGIVNYHDASRNHFTKFCLVWTGVGRLMNNCLEHNGVE